jgi:hypothetical protein
LSPSSWSLSILFHLSSLKGMCNDIVSKEVSDVATPGPFLALRARQAKKGPTNPTSRIFLNGGTVKNPQVFKPG